MHDITNLLVSFLGSIPKHRQPRQFPQPLQLENFIESHNWIGAVASMLLASVWVIEFWLMVC